jgi:hypothetical protein
MIGKVYSRFPTRGTRHSVYPKVASDGDLRRRSIAMNEPLVISSGSRVGWAPLFDPPGEIPSAGAELTAFSSFDGRFTCGLWEREPDTWSFERP